MAYETDDMLWRVDTHYLGPPGKTLPFPVRYTAFYVALGVLLTSFILLRVLLHLDLSYNLLLAMLVITLLITQRIMKRIDADYSVAALFRETVNDVVAPRPAKPNKPITLGALPTDRMSCHLHDGWADDYDEPFVSEPIDRQVA